MRDNDVLFHASKSQPFTDEAIRSALGDVSSLTSFEPEGEIQRRFFYDRDQTWRVRIKGTLDGKLVSLRLENLRLETNEEEMRRAFRLQANSVIRPPLTYAYSTFDPVKGYAWSLDEWVGDNVLFNPESNPGRASRLFMPFYDALRLTVKTAFTDPPEMDAAAFSADQLRKWTALASERNPDAIVRHADLLARLEAVILRRFERRSLQFMHAHLSGADVRVVPTGEYVVFANHFWSWRQPAYDIAFAIWNQWMACPAHHRTPYSLSHVTFSWIGNLRSLMTTDHEERAFAYDEALPVGSPKTWFNEQDLHTMLLNRCYGALILDIPAKLGREPAEDVAALEAAVVAEAGRLLGRG